METLRPLSFFCGECNKSYNFSFQSSMDTFAKLHKVQHELNDLRWKRNPDVFVLTESDKVFFKQCGVAI